VDRATSVSIVNVPLLHLSELAGVTELGEVRRVHAHGLLPRSLVSDRDFQGSTPGCTPSNPKGGTPMHDEDQPGPSLLTRRSALALGAGALGGAAIGGTPSASATRARRTRGRHGKLPVAAIEGIIGAEGSVSSGVLEIGVERSDIGTVQGPKGVRFPPSFQIHGDLSFQPLSNTRAYLNGDFALRASELNPVIDALHRNGLVFQAMHQHFFDLDPMVWFIHFRGEGDATALARSVRKVLEATATPLPQKQPANPQTPLAPGKLAKTLHGASEIGRDGVVTVSINRRDRILLGDVHISPEANVSTTVEFLPLDATGARVAAAPDFSMTVDEIGPVCRTMRAAGFEIGCLYNQETGEHPQLYFAHMIATGSPQELAVKIRKGLDHTKAD